MGKIRKIVNGVVVEVDENQPVKTIVDGVVVEKPLSEVKKKEVLDGGGTTAQVAPVSGGTVGSSAPLSEREKIANYVKTLGGGVKQVSGDKTVGNTKAIVQAKPTKKAETTFDQTKEEAVSGGINKINEIMYDTNDDWKDPIKVSLEKSVDRTQGNKSNLEYLAANVLTRDAILKSGYNASKMLETTPIWAMAKPGENMTADLLKQKTAEFENKVRPFDEIQINEFDNGDGSGNDEFYKYVYGDKIYNAAIKAHALKNENFKDQLLAKGATYEDFENGDLMKFVPSGKLGQIVSESVYDPDVAEYLKNEKPYLFNGLKAVASSLIEDDKVFGANVVANKISREFLKKRNLSPLEYVADFATQGLKDEINEYAKNNLTEQEYRVYQNKILGNEEKYLDTPSLLEGFASGGKQIFSGIKSTFTTPFKSQSEIIDEGWKQEASNVSADPEGMLKFLRDSGHTLGIVGGIASLGGPLGGGGTGFYATKVVPALSGTIPFLGDMLQEGTMKYPDSPVKAWTSAMFNTALYAALSYRIFPAKDVEKAFTAVKPEVAVVVKNLTNGSITREVARKEMNTIAVKALDFLAGTQIKSGKIAAELTGISALNQMLDKVMGMDDKTYEKYHPEGELSDTFGSLFLSNQFVGGLAKYGEMKRGNRIVEASLYEAASNPLKFQREVELLKTKDESIDTNQILDNLKFLTEVKKELDARGIKPSNQGRYMFEAMKEKVFADAVKSTPDSNMIRPMKESIKRGEEVKESILEGEDVVGNEQFELQKENKALSADQIAIQKALSSGEIKGTYKDIAEVVMKDPESAKEFVENIKSQSIGDVSGEIGNGREISESAFGKGLVDYSINKKEGEPERVSQPIELDIINMSDADIENEMTKLELSGDRDRFNLLEKEMEKRERDTVFSVELDKVENAVDALMKKEKEMPNGWGAFIEKQDATQTKAVAKRYLKAKELTDNEIIKDFKDSMFGNPDTWYADGLKLRESMKEAANRGIEVRDLVKQIENEFISDGYAKEDAQEMVARKMAKILEGSTKVDESKMISKGQTKVEAGSVGVGGDVDLKGDKKQDWMNELVVSKNKRKADIQNDIDSFKKDESVNKLVKSFDNADDLKGFCDTLSQRFADKLVEEGVDAKDIQLIEGVGLKNGLDANSAKALSDTEPKYISHVVVKIGDNVIDLSGKQFGDKYSENVIPYSEFKKNWNKVKDWGWEHEQVKKIKFAIELDKYQKAISEGRMTATDAKKIIESAGLEVPKDIAEQSIKEQPKSDIDAKKEAIETEKQQAITEATKPVVEGKEVKPEPPNIPPSEPKPVKEGGETKGVSKAILKRIVESENVSKSVKENLEKDLKYKPQSHDEARKIAKDIVKEFGEDESVSMAESGRFDGGVASSIFAEAIDRTYEKEQSAKTQEEKMKYAEQWMDYSVRYANSGVSQGRFGSAVAEFYKTSPIGFMMKKRGEREQEFNEWYKGREKPFKEVFEEMKNDPDFKAYVKLEVQKATKQERAVFRQKRRTKIVDAFNKAKIKTNQVNSAIIPPQVWNAAVEVMKQATLAGEHILDVIEKGVEHIKNNHKDAWDEKAFREDWKERLEGLDSDKQRVEVPEKYLERMRKKLSGMTESQKEDVIRKSFRKLVENGALEYDDFKKIVADTIGLGELSAEDVAKIQSYIKDMNDVQDLQERVVSENTKEALEAFEMGRKKAEKSATELASMVYNKPDVGKLLRTIAQLNTMGVVSLVKNFGYNIAQTLLVNLPKSIILTSIDHTIWIASLVSNKLFGTKIVKPDFNVIAAQRGYFGRGSEGLKISVNQLFTGLTNKDYFQKEVYNSQIKPFKSWKDIWDWGRGNKYLTRNQILSAVIQGTIGVHSEMVARVLNVGDKPFRFAAEGAMAETIATQDFHLHGIDRKIFLAMPKEKAKDIFLKRGLSEEEAAAKAEKIEQRIIRAGEEAVFQQANIISEKIEQLKKASNENAEKNPLAGFGNEAARWFGVLNMPFVKTPVNIAWEVFNLVNPEFALMQSFVYGARAAKTKSQADYIQAKKWMAHAATGLALLSAAGYLASIGAVTGDDEDQAFNMKEAKGKEAFAKNNRLNWSKLNRAVTGGSTKDMDGDVMVDLSWFGAPGMILNMQANKQENMTKEEREKMGYVEDLLYRLKSGARDGLVNSVFSGTFTAVDAMRTGKADQWLLGMMNVGMNIFEPATVAQLSRAMQKNEYRVTDDDFSKKAQNSIKSRFFGTPPTKYNIWGDPMKKDNSFKGILWNMFGFSSFDKDAIGEPVYQDFKRTGDYNFFPSVPQPDFEVDGEKKQLPREQLDQFQVLVGQARKNYAQPFLADAAILTGYDKKYSQLSDPEKLEALKEIYKKGYDAGKEQFLALHPEYDTREKEPDYEGDLKKKTFKSSLDYQ